MNFRLNEDEEALKSSLRRFCDAEITIERWRKIEGQGFDRKLWTDLAEMGVFALRLSEKDGGAALGMASAALVFIELGRKLAPGPTIWTHLAAGMVEGVVGCVDGDAKPILIEHLNHLDHLMIFRQDGLYTVPRASLSGAKEIATPLDPLTPVTLLESLPKGERIGGPDRAQAWKREASLLIAAMHCGIAEATLELAVHYSKLREQFGRPVGSFQALKHMMADMLARKEVARAGVYAAGATFDDPAVGDFGRAVRAASVTARDAAIKNARACIQIYGGMGYTWEEAPHYYLKRALVLDRAFSE